MKNLKKLLCLLLCAVMLTGAAYTPASASFLTEKAVSTKESRISFGDKINDIIQTVVKGICKIYPKPRTWKSIDEFTGENVYNENSGRKAYQTEKSENAVWRVGYSQGSIIPEDFAAGKYYLGRQLNFFACLNSAKAEGVLDDQMVRVICLDDNTGKGAVVMAVIDGLGVTSATIRKIRAELTDYVKDGRIAAVNVSATHCHSALDTQGVSTSFSYVLLANVITNLLGTDRAKTSNDAFIENLINVSVDNIKKAYDNMEKGKMYYDTADIGDYARDKRGYIDQSNTPTAGILHFVPENEGSKETYFVNMTCHPTNVSAKAELVSSDYPFYIDYIMKSNNKNFIMTQGAVGQISGKGLSVENKENYLKATNELSLKEKVTEELYDKSSVDSADIFGEKMAEIFLNAKNDGEEEIEPIINAKYTSTSFTTDNYTLHLACRIRLVDNEVYTTGSGLDDVCLPSEIGYLEFGGRVAYGLYPCELYPEVFHGQGIITNDKENYSYDGTQWTIKSGSEMVKDKLGSNIDTYAICFANDYIGYVVPDNFYSGWGHWALKGSDCANYTYDTSKSIFDYAFAGTADQILSAGKECASTIMNGFESIIDAIAQGK